MRILNLVICLLISSIVMAQTELEKALFELPDVIFQKIDTPDGYDSAYKLMIKQPLDHSNPAAGHFYQKVYLSHKDSDRPTAIITNGYNANRNRMTEIAALVDGNQLSVEHRYFGESLPDTMDYKYLNFEQVAGDLHRIRAMFSDIYPEKWLASGISKGGTTTIFYKYFYPDDVAVSVPYVAPLNHEYEEKRIYEFLNNIGSKACREDLYDIQKDLLQNTDKNLELMKWFTKGKGLTFNYLTLGEAYEYAVLELPFSFWQYGHDCDKIPLSGTNDEQLNYLLDIVGLDFYSDEQMVAFGSHYYQSATEMGYYGYETKPFKGMLKHLKMNPHPHAAFTPDKMKTSWRGDLTNKAAKWIDANGNNMIFINGAIDTWSATAVPPSKKTNSLYYFLKDKHHASARIKNMTSDEKSKMVNALEKWLEIDIDKD